MRFCGIALIMLIAGTSCDRSGPESLTVSTAVSLAPAMRALARQFESEVPRLTIVLNSGGSALLARQIERGAPADLFIAAAPRELDRLERSGWLVADSRVPLASNRLTIVTHAGSDPIDSPEQLTESRVGRIAVANPATAPLGRYTRKALIAAGVLDRIEAKLVLAEHARQTLEYARRGEVDAAIVYASDVGLGGEDLVQGGTLAARPAILYQGAVISGSARGDLGRRFLGLVRSETGRGILTSHGLLPPPERSPAGGGTDGVGPATTGARW